MCLTSLTASLQQTALHDVHLQSAISQAIASPSGEDLTTSCQMRIQKLFYLNVNTMPQIERRQQLVFS